MNCIHHPDIPATAYCRTCGKALCEGCQSTAQGTIYCSEHAPAISSDSAAAAPPTDPRVTQTYAGAAPSPYTAPVAAQRILDTSVSPGLAFVLGLIPGVGAIYNAQYVKGVIHVVILGILISIISSEAGSGVEPLFGMLIAVWWFYMAFEAYHTARKRQLGFAVDEFSSIIPLHRRRGFPVAPVVLIAIGILFLLNTMEILRFSQLIRYWPVALIVLGAYMLYERLAGNGLVEDAPREVSHEHR